MTRQPPRAAMTPIVLRDVTEDPRNFNTRWGTSVCPRCGSLTRFRQDRFPMNYWKMQEQVWQCQVCEWAFPGVFEGDTPAVDSQPYKDPSLE